MIYKLKAYLQIAVWRQISIERFHLKSKKKRNKHLQLGSCMNMQKCDKLVNELNIFK